MDEPMTYLWDELAAEYVRRTNQTGNPIPPDRKSMQDVAKELGLPYNSSDVTATAAQARELLTKVADLFSMTIDYSDMDAASAAPGSSEAPPEPPPQPQPTGNRRARRAARKCAGHRVVQGVVTEHPCGIKNSMLKMGENGSFYCDNHIDQGNLPVVDDPRAELVREMSTPRVDVPLDSDNPRRATPWVQDESGISYPSEFEGDEEVQIGISELNKYEPGGPYEAHSMPSVSLRKRRELDSYLRQLPGYVHRNHRGRVPGVRNAMIRGEVDPATFEWEDSKSKKPQGSNDGRKPKKGPKIKKKVVAAKPPPKKSKSKTKAGKATKNNRSTGSGKGSAMPVRTADDIRKDAEKSRLKENDDKRQAHEYVIAWEESESDRERDRIMKSVPKKLRQYLPAEMTGKEKGKEKKDGSKVDAKLLRKVKELKDDGMSNTEAFAELIDDDVDEKLAEQAVDAVYDKKGK